MACADTTDNTARLACYDAAVARLRQAEQTGQVVSIDRQGATALQHESFGFNLPNLARLLPSFHGGDEHTLDEIQSQLVSITLRGYDQHVFHLANNQTWVQVGNGPVYSVKVGDAVIIRKAALGSYMLLSPHGGGGNRVHRED
jgi:hypothetical protein